MTPGILIFIGAVAMAIGGLWSDRQQSKKDKENEKLQEELRAESAEVRRLTEEIQELSVKSMDATIKPLPTSFSVDNLIAFELDSSLFEQYLPELRNLASKKGMHGKSTSNSYSGINILPKTNKPLFDFLNGKRILMEFSIGLPDPPAPHEKYISWIIMIDIDFNNSFEELMYIPDHEGKEYFNLRVNPDRIKSFAVGNNHSNYISAKDLCGEKVLVNQFGIFGVSFDPNMISLSDSLYLKDNNNNSYAIILDKIESNTTYFRHETNHGWVGTMNCSNF